MAIERKLQIEGFILAVSGVVRKQLAAIHQTGLSLFLHFVAIDIKLRSVRQRDGCAILRFVFLIIHSRGVRTQFNGHVDRDVVCRSDEVCAIVLQCVQIRFGFNRCSALCQNRQRGEVKNQHIAAMIQAGHLKTAIVVGCPEIRFLLNLLCVHYALGFRNNHLRKDLRATLIRIGGHEIVPVDGDVQLGGFGNLRQSHESVGALPSGINICRITGTSVCNDVIIIFAIVQQTFEGRAFHRLIGILNALIFVDTVAFLDVKGSNLGVGGRVKANHPRL